MPIHVFYRGVALEFDAPPTGQQIKAAYDAHMAKAAPTTTQPDPEKHSGGIGMSGGHELSSIQKSIWFMTQMDPEDPSYVISVVLRLRGALDVAAFNRVVHKVMNRQHVLRTTFTSIDGIPYQTVKTALELEIPFTDLTCMPSGKRDEAAFQLLEGQVARPFDLQAGPLIRVQLAKVDDTEHLVLMTLHHIISDGPSIAILVEELGEHYAAEVSGGNPDLPDLPGQYVDFVARERSELGKESSRAQKLYWHEKFAGEIPVMDLPTDRPSSVAQTYKGASQTVALGPELVTEVRALGRSHKATLFITLLSAFKALLYRYTGQQDLVVGTPATRRDQSNAGLIGCFINMLPLRTSLWGNPTFGELIDRVRLVSLEAYDRQDYPFLNLVETLRPRRETDGSPLFRVVMGFQADPYVSKNLPGLTMTTINPPETLSEYDLILDVLDLGTDVQIKFRYRTDLFDASSIQRMMGHYKRILERSVAAPGTRIANLDFLQDDEKAELVEQRNALPVQGRPVEGLIHQWFEEQVCRTPDHVAAVGGGRFMSYRTLNEQANQLARYLRRRGVGPDVLVGICVERDLDMLVGILGILKAGGAYVPLDPNYPKARLLFTLQDVNAPFLLTQERLLKQLPEAESEVICLDRDATLWQGESVGNLAVINNPRDLAYIIYTSGSTGQPKGVQIQHGNVTRLFSATQPLYHFTDRDVWTMLHSYAFDFSVWEMYGALLYGGRVILVPKETAQSLDAFWDEVRNHRVTVLNFTPSAFYEFDRVDEAHPEAQLSEHVRYVIFGGEALRIESLRAWYARYGEAVTLVNMYGITETTVHVTYLPLSPKELDVPRRGSPIGVPMADLEMYVLDQNRQLVPLGVPGELYVGGSGVGRGYLNRPDLTEQRFVDNPFAQEGSRLYRTGDLVRKLADGTFEYLGRIDQQVKIRGYRVELGEIEAVIAAHEAVSQCVVVVRESPDGKKQLVAYVAVRPTDPGSGTRHIVSPAELRSYAQENLPPQMAPAHFVVLTQFPRTPTGKIDYGALPTPDEARLDLQESYVGPRNEDEALVAKVWAEVLGCGCIGINDNYFDLGGDSLRAVQVVARLTMAGFSAKVKDLFAFPTVAQLCQQVARTGRTYLGDERKLSANQLGLLANLEGDNK